MNNLCFYRGAFTLKDFMESAKPIDKAEVGKAMEKVDYDDPVCVFFTSVTKILFSPNVT